MHRSPCRQISHDPRFRAGGILWYVLLTPFLEKDMQVRFTAAVMRSRFETAMVSAARLNAFSPPRANVPKKGMRHTAMRSGIRVDRNAPVLNNTNRLKRSAHCPAVPSPHAARCVGPQHAQRSERAAMCVMSWCASRSRRGRTSEAPPGEAPRVWRCGVVHINNRAVGVASTRVVTNSLEV